MLRDLVPSFLYGAGSGSQSDPASSSSMAAATSKATTTICARTHALTTTPYTHANACTYTLAPTPLLFAYRTGKVKSLVSAPESSSVLCTRVSSRSSTNV